MNIPRILAVLLLAAPASASAAPHSLAVRVSQGTKSYAHTVKAEAGAQTSFVGPVGGRNMIVNAVLIQARGTLTLQYQIEVSRPDGSSSFQVQSSVALRPGDRLRAVECGNWKLDVALDAPIGAAAPRAWSPAGPNHRLTAVVGKRRCRIVQEAGTQGNIVDSSKINGRKTGFILNANLSALAGDTCKLQYQLEDSPRQAQGEETLVLSKKASAHGGMIEFLLEGPASAPSPPAPAEGGGVPLLR
ncbi:MAG: hypothetical protein PHS14_03990 [Elusimicrobia bacterium]|nr:hypothetical protein [Elusimicrobiota bacterium]